VSCVIGEYFAMERILGGSIARGTAAPEVKMSGYMRMFPSPCAAPTLRNLPAMR
jgi:hypothetical protein